MPRRRTITGTIINTAVFILLEIAALNMLTHSGQLQNFFIFKVAHGFMGSVWGTTSSIRHYASLKKENEKLAGEIFELNKKLHAMNQQTSADSALAKMMNSSASGNFKFMPAEIVKNSLNKQHNYLIIGKGSADGVVPQTGIITNNGVVGIVDAVSRHYSYAISFLNTESSISARVRNDGAVGPMSWDGKNFSKAILKEIPLQYKFEPGDTVYTSGFSTIFPADIPLGSVKESKIVNGATYEISVDLFLDFTTVRYVTLIQNKDNAEIRELEKNIRERE